MKLKMWQKIFIVGIIPVISISILLSIFLYNSANESASNISKNAISDQVKRIDLSINTRVKLIETSLTSLSKIVSTAIERDTENQRSKELLDVYSRNMMSPFSEIRSTIILLNDNFQFSTEENLSLNQSTLDIFKEMVENSPDKIITANDETSIFNKVRSSRSFYIFRSIDDTTGKVEGLVLFEISYRILGINMLSQQRIQQNQTIFLLNENKELIYSDNYLPEKVRESVIQNYLKGARKVTLKIDNVSYYIYMLYSGTTGWIIVSFIPVDKLFPQAATFKNDAIIIITLAIFFSIVFIYTLSKIILKPVLELKNAMLSVKQNHLNLSVNTTSTDEIGDLSSAFNYMVTTLKELINQNYKQKIARQEAEMKALQAQINPHFLYNTLDSINWMLIDHQEYDLSDIIVSLGKLMRYSMQTDISIVTLKEEYDNVRDYLILQKFRIEDKLEYTLTLDYSLENFKIPRLILQPLVENSIIHGIIPQEGSGHIVVKTTKKEHFLLIEISDTGKGMDNLELAKYRALFKESQENSSIGVTNVVKRLRYFYGNKFSINVNSIKGKGTCLQIHLPILNRE